MRNNRQQIVQWIGASVLGIFAPSLVTDTIRFFGIIGVYVVVTTYMLLTMEARKD